MDSNFIEIYENALSDDLCDMIVNEFEYLNSSKKTYRGVFANPNGEHDFKVKDSWDTDLYDYFKEVNDLDLKFDSYYNQLTYVDFFRIIGDVSSKYFLEYDKKYDCTSIFTNLKENNYWPYGDIEKVNTQDFIRSHYKPQETVLIKKYNKNNQGYHVFHSDFDSRSNHWLKRSHVLMFYLNDVEEGGETEWYHQKLKVKPKKGTLVIWPAYFTHLHKGHVPISNDKYIMNLWMSDNHPTPYGE